MPVLRCAKCAQDACQLQQREALHGSCLQACLCYSIIHLWNVWYSSAEDEWGVLGAAWRVVA